MPKATSRHTLTGARERSTGALRPPAQGTGEDHNEREDPEESGEKRTTGRETRKGEEGFQTDDDYEDEQDDDSGTTDGTSASGGFAFGERSTEAIRTSSPSFCSESSDGAELKHTPTGVKKKRVFQQPSKCNSTDPNPSKSKSDESTKELASRRPPEGVAIRLPGEPSGSSAARFSALEDPAVSGPAGCTGPAFGSVHQSSAGKGPRVFRQAESSTRLKKKAKASQLEQLSPDRSLQIRPSTTGLSESPH